jgi:hypothetical protein
MSVKRPLNRAEEVRRRRDREGAQREQRATQRAYRPLPPVTARGTSYAAPRQAQHAPARRFQTALGGALPQTRLNIPHLLPDVWSGARLVSLTLVFVLIGALYFLWTSPTFHVTQPLITGAARMDPTRIAAGLGVDGQSIFLMRADELEARLRLGFPELASAQVTIGLPNQVSVSVTERQPIILWQQGEGYTWVDSSGVAFHPHGQVDGLILVRALAAPPGGLPAEGDPFAPPAYVAPDIVKAIQTLAPSAAPGSTLIYDPADGLGWNDGRGWQVFFGTDPKDMTLKLQVYQSLVDSLLQRNIYPVLISVVHADAPYYRMEQ